MRVWVPLAAAALAALPTSSAFGQTVRLQDGRMLSGRVARTTSVAENPNQPSLTGGEVATRPIVIVDDDLRRVYVPRIQVVEIPEMGGEPPVVIRPWQNPAHGAARMASVGPALGITPFDEYGRRIYEMQFEGGRLAVVQGITELTPRYAKVEALMGPDRVISWDMRIATTSIPRETLSAIIAHAIPQNDPMARLQAVRFYSQGRRYHEARVELERIIEEFPALEELKVEAAELQRRAAKALLDELQLRRSAGQHRLVQTLLESFPVDQVAGDTLVQVRELLVRYEAEEARIGRIGETLTATVAAIEDPDHRGLAAPIAEEMIAELTHNNVERLAPFVQLLDDPELTADEKAALALSGWILGPDQADRSLSMAIALVRVRDAVQRYLQEPLAAQRQALLDSIISQEGATVPRLARLIARMKPPWHDPKLVATPSGYLELSATGNTSDGDFPYLVQLPAEYDPYRRYPTLLVLNDSDHTPEQALDFWAGSIPPPSADGVAAPRRGQAMRHGYITIAPLWQKPHQGGYEFTGREHVAVLTVLRDASRRFSIDADRVYLTGHGAGGDAAWDLAQAHPDLWAGVLPFVAVSDKYIAHYWDNVRHVPLYFVAGELDGRTMSLNAPVWDLYLRKPPSGAKPGFDVTIVEFQGRGHEPFHDEILNAFDWMGRKTRGTSPKEFACNTLRPFDSFFWWLECGQLPEQFMIHPTEWNSRRARPARVEGKMLEDNRLWARSPAPQTTVWLNPDVVDFDKPVRLTFNGTKASLGDGIIRPDPVVLLEDVRTRGDRQRPFWARIDMP